MLVVYVQPDAQQDSNNSFSVVHLERKCMDYSGMQCVQSQDTHVPALTTTAF